MARLLAGLGTSHVPVIGRTLKAGRQDEVGFKPATTQLNEVSRQEETYCLILRGIFMLGAIVIEQFSWSSISSGPSCSGPPGK